MKRKTNKAKEEAWSQTAHAPDGEQPGPEASDTSGQSVPKSKFRKKSQQEQAAAAKLRMESQGEKLEQAREKLAKQKPPKKPGPVKRIGRVASSSVHSFVHGKIFEVEQENVGTEGAHRSELVGETALRYGSRFVRRKVREHPAKVVRKAEARYTKYTADYHFHTAAQEHPELTKNALTRYWQKQRLRRQYRKQAKEAAKQGAAAAGKTATATERLTARAVEFVKSHPAGAVIAVLCVLLLFAMQSCSSTMLMLGNAGAGALGASTYPCEDRDMLAAEAAYCALEDDLQHYLDTYESTHDYDEYHFDLDEIEHDPYVLLSLLCALHEGQWTIGEVQGTLQMLFDRQYILTEDVVVETRYRTETDTWTDEDGNSHTDTYQVPYDYYICTVTLENFDLSHVPVYVMSEEQLSRYAIYMATLGNRPDLFPDSPYVNKYITGKPGDYEVPGEYLDDETFAAMLAEAQKYIGYPYGATCSQVVCQLLEFAAGVTNRKWFCYHFSKRTEDRHHALSFGNIDPCNIVHIDRSSSWICFGDQPFHHCRSNLFDDTGAPRRWLNLHKSNAANERLADGLHYGRYGPWRNTSGQDSLILTALATMRKKTRLAAVP